MQRSSSEGACMHDLLGWTAYHRWPFSFHLALGLDHTCMSTQCEGPEVWQGLNNLASRASARFRSNRVSPERSSRPIRLRQKNFIAVFQLLLQLNATDCGESLPSHACCIEWHVGGPPSAHKKRTPFATFASFFAWLTCLEAGMINTKAE